MANFSQAFSFKGWNFWEWLRGNKEAVKIVVSAGFGLWIPTSPGLKLLAGSLTKLALDSIDYFCSQVEL